MFSRAVKPVIALAPLVGGVAGAQAEGLYVGGALGAPDYSSSINGYGGGDGGRGTGLKLFGGYQLSPHFAIEGGLFDLGRTRDTGGSAKVRGGYVDGVGSYEFAPKWSALGSIGLAQARLSTPTGDDTSPGLKLGVGVQYDLTRTTALRLGYDRYRFADAFDAKPDVGETSFGVKVSF